MANRIQTNTNLLQEQKQLLMNTIPWNELILKRKGYIVSLAGRVILKRNQGKTTFCVLKDSTEKIQLYLNRDVLGEEKYIFSKTY